MATLKLNGKRVFYNDGGSPWQPGRPGVVLVHGAGMHHVVWHWQARSLSRYGFNVAAVDLPGHGESENQPGLETVPAYAEWLSAFIAALGPQPVRLVGNSLGAGIALALAATHPAQVTALALLGTRATMKVSPQLMSDLENQAQRGVDFIAAYALGLQAHMGAAPTPGSSLMGFSKALLEACDPQVMLRDFRASDAFDAAPLAPRVACPTLVLSGEADRMTPTRYSLELAKAIPGAVFRTLPGVGHLPQNEDPRGVTRILVEFFRSQVTSAA